MRPHLATNRPTDLSHRPVFHSSLNSDLADNALNGALPDQWAAGMDSLRAANMTNNSLVGALPENWSNLTSLRAL
jgi:hypothetical protein